MKEIEEYDVNGNCTHYRDEQGCETWYKYDENSNLLHRKEGDKEGDGIEQFFDYDENDLRIHDKQTGGILNDDYEQWYEYDREGRLVYYRNSKGEKRWYKYKLGKRIKIEKEEFEVLNVI